MNNKELISYIYKLQESYSDIKNEHDSLKNKYRSLAIDRHDEKNEIHYKKNEHNEVIHDEKHEIHYKKNEHNEVKHDKKIEYESIIVGEKVFFKTKRTNYREFSKQRRTVIDINNGKYFLKGISGYFTRESVRKDK